MNNQNTDSATHIVMEEQNLIIECEEENEEVQKAILIQLGTRRYF